MFPDPRRRFGTLALEAMALPPQAVYTDDGGVAHRLWRVSDPATRSAASRRSSAGPKAYIADGHHRHATALRYRDAHGPDGAWTFGYFTPMGAPGLLVQPYHRILSEGPSLDEAAQKLGSRFRVTRAPGRGRRRSARAAHSKAPYAFALAEPGQGALVVEAEPGAESLLDPRPRRACARSTPTSCTTRCSARCSAVPDTAVSYVHSQAEAEEAVAAGRAAAWRCCCGRRRSSRSWTSPRRGSRCRPRAPSSTRSSPPAS